MRKLLLIAISVLMLFSCVSEIDIPTNVKIKWRFKLNGVEYRWSGNYLSLDTDGSSIVGVSENNALITGFSCNGPCASSTKNGPQFSFFLPKNFSTGKYVLNQKSFGIQDPINVGMILINDNNVYLSAFEGGGNLTVNILESSNKVNGIVKGTFSGSVIQATNLTSHVISDGYFEAVRSN
jgi:hypothetical protein